jgi:hypothetical protein
VLRSSLTEVDEKRNVRTKATFGGAVNAWMRMHAVNENTLADNDALARRYFCLRGRPPADSDHGAAAGEVLRGLASLSRRCDVVRSLSTLPTEHMSVKRSGTAASRPRAGWGTSPASLTDLPRFVLLSRSVDIDAHAECPGWHRGRSAKAGTRPTVVRLTTDTPPATRIGMTTRAGPALGSALGCAFEGRSAR